MLLRALELAFKDPAVVWFRGRQAAVQRVWRTLALWPRLETRVADYWTEARAREWLAAQRAAPRLFPRGLESRLAAWAERHPAAAGAVGARARAVMAGAVPVFGGTHQVDWSDPRWHRDWRSGHEWPAHFHADYRFYQPAAPGAEVKFPWELSRLGFLQPVALAGCLEEGPWGAWIAARVADWSNANPCAESVNWYPMECSLRGVNLTVSLLLLAANPRTAAAELVPLFRALTLQAEFVARNTEYSRHRENHFAANVACLGLTGRLLPAYPGSPAWRRASRRWLPREIESQFLPDGVNFEQSTAYHRLTAELFLLTAFAAAQSGESLPPAARDRLRAAAEAMAALRHPDGTAAVFGDNDSAQTLTAAGDPPGRRDAALLLAAALLDAPELAAAADADSPWSAVFAAPAPAAVSPARPWPGSATGGFFVARHARNALLADFGRVGFKGLGGHGHNDLFSFELSLDGRKIVVDSGSPVYTGDRHEYDRYRSAKAHNGLTVDDQEIAPLLGWWRIADVARPRELHRRWENGTLEIAGQHDGYRRLADPVTHRRTLRFDARAGRLDVTDELLCRAEHDTVRRLHFAPGLQPEVEGSAARIRADGKVVAFVEWDSYAKPLLRPYLQSPEFGLRIPAQRLELAARVGGGILLTFRLTLP